MSEDALSEYRGKRRAARTPEPVPDARAKRGRSRSRRPTFVIQEHHASSLHWDFRLERDGVLVSWALPKGLPPSPEVNHLAVHVEDHPLEYGTFAGTIPEGEYGGGTRHHLGPRHLRVREVERPRGDGGARRRRGPRVATCSSPPRGSSG